MTMAFQAVDEVSKRRGLHTILLRPFPLADHTASPLEPLTRVRLHITTPVIQHSPLKTSSVSLCPATANCCSLWEMFHARHSDRLRLP